ncbi:MAG: hypothetical protein DRJ52_05545 [Thermoprotei archaeon]|nr:MAG: hypothetical protein DRJ52_05545 [Thermoprotei archaeon]
MEYLGKSLYTSLPIIYTTMNKIKIFLKTLFKNRKFLALLIIAAVLITKVIIAGPSAQPLDGGDGGSDPDPPPGGEENPDLDPLGAGGDYSAKP